MSDIAMSQGRLETLAGFGKGYVNKLVKGVREADKMSVENADRIAEILEVRRDWLFRGEGPKRDVPSDLAAPSERAVPAAPRDVAAHIATELDIPENVIASVLERYRSKAYDNREKYPPRWWLTKFERANDRIVAQRHEIQRAKAALERSRAKAEDVPAPSASAPVKRKAK